MIDSELLKILCCPFSRQALREATAEEQQSVQNQLDAGTLKNRAGESVRESFESALVTIDGKILYPIRQNIPVMLVDESILLS